jgi:predicted metal-binding membrane protein
VPQAVAPEPRRRFPADLLISAAAILSANALAWVWLLQQPALGMAGMPGHGIGMRAAEPWSTAYLATTFLMWTLMMVAMMLPSAMPMLLLQARLNRAPTRTARLGQNALALLAYLLIWTGFSALATVGQALLTRAGLFDAMGMALTSRTLSGILLLAAAAYQLSGIKRACLNQCRSPVQFVMRYWKPSALGAVRLGLAHGLFCVGCCWGLMLLLFVGGVMNVGWIAALAAVVFIEKVAPRHWHASVMIALLLAGAGFLLLVG